MMYHVNEQYYIDMTLISILHDRNEEHDGPAVSVLRRAIAEVKKRWSSLDR
jgi:hypothetical protein